MTAIITSSTSVDVTPELLAARAALKSLASRTEFREYMARVISRGPLSDLDRREREGKSIFKLIYVRGNGFDAPLATYLVLSIPHEAIGMPGFESAFKLHVRFSAEHDGFWKTRSVKSAEFREKLSRCKDPEFLENAIREIFGA